VHIATGAFHGFDRIAAKSSVARAYFESQVASLQQALKV
jgi:hypothetical protein